MQASKGVSREQDDLHLSDFIANNLTTSNPESALIKKRARQYYTSISQGLASTVFGEYSIFLNYGYVPDGSPEYSPIKLPPNMFNRNSTKLVLEVIGDCDLNDCLVLDISCGRGGTLATISKYYRPLWLLGLDLTPANVMFGAQHLNPDLVNLMIGEAEKLPLPSESLDAITNLEASHLYPGILNYYAEVYRLLRTDGYFLYTDMFNMAHLQRNLAFLRDLGFEIEQERDITHNVLLSLDETADKYLKIHGARDASQYHDLANFVAAPGSIPYEEMKCGKLSYRIYKMRKTGQGLLSAFIALFWTAVIVVGQVAQGAL